MRRTWTEVAATLAESHKRSLAEPPQVRDAQLAALEQIVRELASTFSRRSSRFSARRFFEIIGVTPSQVIEAADTPPLQGDEVV
jgi:hypothetical protein